MSTSAALAQDFLQADISQVILDQGQLDKSAQRISTGPLGVDQGDYYWYGKQQVPLYRAANELTVNLHEGAAVSQFLEELNSGAQSQSTIQVDRWLADDELTVSINGAADEIAAALDGLTGVEWVAPSFINGESGQRQWLTDEIVVALEPAVDPASFFAADTFSGYSRLLGTTDQFVGKVTTGGLGTLDVANALHSDPRIVWSTPNFYSDIRTTATPNDGLFNTQWHLRNTGQGGALSGADANLATAWNTTTGSNGVVIAVVDNGVQTNHPDLTANVFVNSGEIPSNGIDDDGNGWVDDVNGWDWADNDNNPNPATQYDNHGTAVAGVAAAAGNNALGVSGASWSSEILPLKIAKDTVGNGDGFVSDALIAQAIYYAAGRTADGLGTWRGADVINSSWGGGSPDATLTNAFNWASVNGRGGKGTPIFVASGNGASGYVSYTLSGIPVGNWIFEWRYVKNNNRTGGDDTVWLSNVGLPNGSAQRFDSPGLPAGWSTSGNANWTVVDDPSHAFGTGRYEAKAGSIGNNQTTTLRSATVAVSATSSLTFSGWVSSELNDRLNVYASNNGGSSFSGPYFGSSGVTAITSAVAYPASLASTIAVGASTDWDYRSDYSEYGSALDFVAPSSGGYQRVVTTDRTGTDGYSSGDYTSTGSDGFGGTSSATPLAAGVGALLLSKDPTLTASEVRAFMRDSAVKIGGNNGASAYNGSGFNQYYGYGRIDAAAAVAAVMSLMPSVSIAPLVSHLEGDAGTTPYVFTVTLSAASDQTVTVDYSTADGTATTADGDYVAASGTLTFTPGQTQQLVTVLVNGDTTNEADETFTLALSGPMNATLGTASATGVIENDDPLTSVALSPASVAQPEGDSGTTPYVFTVTLSAVSGQTVTVVYSTADDTATTTDGDYVGTSGTLTFAPGQTTQEITVSVIGDTQYEPDESFLVNLADPTNGILSTSQAAGTIVNDDATVNSTHLFYKGSTKWNVTNGATFSDDNAIAPDKTAYLPGSGTATFSAVSSYSRGINGLMVDIAGPHGTLTVDDFIFKIGNNNSPNTWATATAPTTVTTRAGAGASGSDRTELIWGDNAIEKTWLEVIVKGDDTLGGSDTNTGLASSYVFFWGNAPGDSGAADASAFSVTSSDEISARNDPHGLGNPATRSNVNDFDRDSFVNSSDQIIARNNATGLGNQLTFLVVGAGGPFAPESSSSGVPLVDSASQLGYDVGVASALASATVVNPTTIASSAPPEPRTSPTGVDVDYAPDASQAPRSGDDDWAQTVARASADNTVEPWMPDDDLLDVLTSALTL